MNDKRMIDVKELKLAITNTIVKRNKYVISPCQGDISGDTVFELIDKLAQSIESVKTEAIGVALDCQCNECKARGGLLGQNAMIPYTCPDCINTKARAELNAIRRRG